MISLSEKAIDRIAQPLNNTNTPIYFYLAGVLFKTVLTVKALVELRSILKTSDVKKIHHHNVLFSDKIDMPFSLGKYIVIPKNGDLPLKMVIQHESIHYDQWHTADLILFELNKILLWWSPASHFLPSCIREVHEYQVDQKMTHIESSEHYVKTLLSWSLGVNPFFITHSFSTFNLKKRFDMILKKKSNSLGYLKLSVVLTFLVASFTFVGCEAQEIQKEQDPGVVPISELDLLPRTDDCPGEITKEESISCFQNGIANHIIQNFDYPESCKKLGLEGKVYVSFTIDENGKVTEVAIARGVQDQEGLSEDQISAYKEMEASSLEIVNSMPSFKPAKVGSKEVAMDFNVPIAFKLK